MLRKAIKNSNGHLPQINPNKSRASRGEFARRLNKSKIPFETKENITETSTHCSVSKLGCVHTWCSEGTVPAGH